LSIIPPLVIFWKIYFEGHSSGHTGSNDTGLEFLSCRGPEKKGGQTHTQTDRQADFGYYYIDVCPLPLISIGLLLFEVNVIKNLSFLKYNY
jgi:hypothetical protein